MKLQIPQNNLFEKTVGKQLKKESVSEINWEAGMKKI